MDWRTLDYDTEEPKQPWEHSDDEEPQATTMTDYYKCVREGRAALKKEYNDNHKEMKAEYYQQNKAELSFRRRARHYLGMIDKYTDQLLGIIPLGPRTDPTLLNEKISKAHHMLTMNLEQADAIMEKRKLGETLIEDVAEQ